jgi:hypothetical protein
MSTPTPKTFTSEAARLEHFRVNLATNDKWALRALIVIYERQTDAEKSASVTTESNGVGFSGADAEILTSFAKRVKNFNPGVSLYASPLSPRQMEVLKNRIKKYAAQIIKSMGDKAPAIVKTPKNDKGAA